MSRDYKVYLLDILSAIKKIEKYTSTHTLTRFYNDELVVDAVVRNLEIIGEAVKNLPEAFKSKHQQIEWKKIAGLRDILIHEYFGVDQEILWDIVKNKLPQLKKELAKLK